MYDVVIIGGGHNGLVAASYLAEKGLKVAVFERREIIGGACVTEELWKGVKVNTGAYVLSLFHKKIIEDLKLDELGLKVYVKEPGLYLPMENGKNLFIYSNKEKTLKEIEKFSRNDKVNYEKWLSFWNKYLPVFKHLMLSPPVSFYSLIDISKKLGIKESDVDELLRIIAMDGKRLLDEFFESEELKTALIEDAVVGANASPSTPGTAYVLIHHNLGEVNGVQGAWGYIEGGMGELSRKLMKAAEIRGAEIFLGSEVEEIVLRRGEVRGVKIKGRLIEAKKVLSCIDPKSTFLKLMKDQEYDEELSRKVRAIKAEGVACKMVGVLEELPNYNGLGTSLGPQHIASTLIMPDIKYIEDSYRDYLNRGGSKMPWASINIQTSVDKTLAPQNLHVFSIFSQYLSYNAKEDIIKEFEDNLIEAVRRFAPNFNPIKKLFISTRDLEDRFGLYHGNIFHVEMTPDQIFNFRPIPELANYVTPIKGLYLGGAGLHPGGGVTGCPGYNAAMKILEGLG